MHIKIICHSCQHRFGRTAAQVLSEDRCPKCASNDIDVDDTTFEPDYPSCLPDLSGQRGTVLFGPYISPVEVMFGGGAKTDGVYDVEWDGMAHRVAAGQVVTEAEFQSAWHIYDDKGRIVAGGPSISKQRAEEISREGLPGMDYGPLTVKQGSKTAQFFDDRGSKKWFFRFPEGIQDSGGGPYEAVKSNDGEYAVVNLDTNEIVSSSVSWYSGPRGLTGAIEDARRWNANPVLAPDTTGGNDYTGLIPGTASRRTAYSDPSVCDYCGQEGCSPTCPGPGSSGVCPQCGSNLDRNGKCSDPQGCGYGWDREDRGLTFDGEPRFAQRIATKRNRIVQDILQSNPGMPRRTALALADEAIRRYPKAVR